MLEAQIKLHMLFAARVAYLDESVMWSSSDFQKWLKVISYMYEYYYFKEQICMYIYIYI